MSLDSNLTTPTTPSGVLTVIPQEGELSSAELWHPQAASSLVSQTTWRPAIEGKATRHVTESTTASSSSSEFSNPLLHALWMGDVMIALSVTAAVAPMLTIVDKAIVEQSAHSGQRGVLMQSMHRTAGSILANPSGYFRSPTFGWMWLTYAATYTCANLMKTWNEQSVVSTERRLQQSQQRASSKATVKKTASSGSMYLVAGTTLVNSGASLVKDRAYARMFGQSPKPVPLASYAAWMMRDGLVIGSGFVLPAYVAPLVQDAMGCSQATAATVSQLLTPVAVQVVAGPLHLWGLTLYNASPEQSLRQKLAAWQSGLPSVTAARMLRILPGYGVAGVVNQKGRAAWKQYLLQRQIRNNKQDASAMVTLIRSYASSAPGGR